MLNAGSETDHSATLYPTDRARRADGKGDRYQVSTRFLSRTCANKTIGSEIDTSFYVLTVDLWNADGSSEVNLVRHSASSPSISTATSSSYPPPPQNMSPTYPPYAQNPYNPPPVTYPQVNPYYGSNQQLAYQNPYGGSPQAAYYPPYYPPSGAIPHANLSPATSQDRKSVV